MQFTDLHLDDRIVRALSDSGIETCTKVQEETLVHSLAGRDVTVQSQTGTGKTIAFLVTSFQRSLRDGAVSTRTLIVAPTRELAVQIHREAEMVGKNLPHRTGCFYGGVGYGEQERLLRQGVDMVIGTPGRLLDYAGSGKIDMRTFGIIVIDEADRLFDMGFIPDLRRIMRSAMPPSERQTMLFSATLGERVKQLAWEYMNEPISVEIEPDVVTVREVTQLLYHVGAADKMRLLLGVLRKENPQRTLIFTNTKHAAEMIARRLGANGVSSRYIMGDLPQSKRLQLISDMKAGKIPVLVATDVAARGLHIDDVDLVVNYDLPEDRESYVHRIGRTARAGKSGKAISLACERYVYSLEGIEKFINAKIPVAPVTEDLMVEDASAGMAYRSARRGDGGGRRDGRREGGRGPARRPEAPRGEAPRERGGEPRRERAPAGTGAAAGAGTGARGAAGGRGNRGSRAPAGARVSRTSSPEERRAYYLAKYGEEGGRAPAPRPRDSSRRSPAPQRAVKSPEPRAAPAPTPAPIPQAPPPRPTLLARIRGLFGKKGRDGADRA